MNTFWSHVTILMVLGMAHIFCPVVGAQDAPQNSPTPAVSSPQPAPKAGQNQGAAKVSTLPRGKKLILKDGSSEIVSSYSIEADRVRYYSVERSQWEEVPSALVDWDATHRAEAVEAQSQAQQLAAVEKRQREYQAETVDVAASYEVAPGVFLPEGEGTFILQDKNLLAMTPASTDIKNDKRREAERAVVPLPVVPSRRQLRIKGTRATLRVHAAQPEFYVRSSESDEPQVELLRLRVHGGARMVENLDSLNNFNNVVKDSVPIQSWTVAKGLYRFTISRPLTPGEYALTALPADKQDADILVWDFGVDPSPDARH